MSGYPMIKDDESIKGAVCPQSVDHEVINFDEWITAEVKINSGELLIMDDGSIMSWIDLDAASTRYAARLARVAAVLADCPDDSAL